VSHHWRHCHSLWALCPLPNSLQLGPRNSHSAWDLAFAVSTKSHSNRSWWTHWPARRAFWLVPERYSCQSTGKGGKVQTSSPPDLLVSAMLAPRGHKPVNWKLHRDGAPITTRGLVHRQVILRRGEGTFLCMPSRSAGSRRSGGFIITCLYQQEWSSLFSLGKNVWAFRLHDGIGHHHR
jgi:hypothetical protein